MAAARSAGKRAARRQRGHRQRGGERRWGTLRPLLCTGAVLYMLGWHASAFLSLSSNRMHKQKVRSVFSFLLCVISILKFVRAQ